MMNSEKLNLWVEDFLKKRRYSKYELELNGNTSKGDGYLGEVTFVKVLTGIGREEEKIYNLVIKSAKNSKELRKKTPLKEVFDREMFMYTKVFPAFKMYQQELKIINEPFMKFAKCYSIFTEDNNEAIILQNLKYLQYTVHDRKVPQNYEHVCLTFENYAKFHAISLAMKKQRISLFAEIFHKLQVDLLSKFFIQANMVENMTKNFQEALEISATQNNVELKNLDILENLCKESQPLDGFSAILHGDCWNNNMMFLYKDAANQKSPTDLMFIDFQLSSIGSPIYDLSYYLYAVADAEILKNFDSLLEIYLKTLKNSLMENFTEYSYNNVLTVENLKMHWIKYGKFGLIMAPLILKVELSENDEVGDFAEAAEAGDVGETFNIKVKNQKAYNERITAVFQHFTSLFE